MNKQKLMTERERYLATAEFRPVDRTFLIAPWAWDETVVRWRKEGLPTSGGWWNGLAEYFNTDIYGESCYDHPFHNGHGTPILIPPLKREIISGTEEYQIIREEEGNTIKLFRNDPMQSMPQWIEYPVRNRGDWENIIKPRRDWRTPGWNLEGEKLKSYAAEMKEREHALGLWAASLYGWPRCWMGVERLSTMFYDDPDLVHEMCDQIGEWTVQTLTPILSAVQFDFAFIWEDMAGKAGPLCSPDTYREFCFEPLKRVVKLLKKHGIKHIIVDSDGNNEVLIPLWLEAGIDGLRPFEVAAGCDAVATRIKYGKDLIIQGAIDKRALAKGKDEIDREVLSKVPWLCMQGGYFPQVDHLVPPDVSLSNYAYYSKLLREVVEDPGKYLHEAKRRGFWKE